MTRKSKNALMDAAVSAAALLLGVVIASPVVYAVFGAFKTPAEFSAYPPTVFPESFTNLDNFAQVFEKIPVFRYMINSLAVALLGTVVRLICGIFAAYAFAYYEFRGKKVFFFLILATMMLPADTLLVTNYLTVSRLGLLNTVLGMCITSFVGASQMFMLRQNFRSTPKAFREAALLDGCGDIRFLSRIQLSLSRPVVVTLFIQSFVTLWNAYLWPLMVTNRNDMRTIQVGVTMLTSLEDTNYYLVLAGATVTFLPSFILFILLRRSITNGMSAGALVG